MVALIVLVQALIHREPVAIVKALELARHLTLWGYSIKLDCQQVVNNVNKKRGRLI